MANVVQQVGSKDTFGGLSDGYRISQSGVPTSTVGKAPAFRGVTVEPPSSYITSPKVLASAARQNSGTNVAIPYARVVPCTELNDKGRLEPGDIAFLHKPRYSSVIGGSVGMNAAAKNARQERVSVASQSPHADIHNMAGVDWINRKLTNFIGGRTVLLNSVNPSDHWRSLSFIAEWVVDGVIMSNDSPGYAISSSNGSRNDQLFNIAIQGPAQVNNGFQDDLGVGISTDRPVPSWIAGPFYHMYPLQMFDRKIRTMSEIYIGLICRKIEGAELAEIKNTQGERLKGDSGFKTGDINSLHCFQYVLFSDRQVWQLMDEQKDTNGKRSGSFSEPPNKRRGPLDPEGERTAFFNPRQSEGYHQGAKPEDRYKLESLNGITENEIHHMVGAWKIGKVLDTKSGMKQEHNGLSDTGFRLTVNVDVSFLDWRALRRRFSYGGVGDKHANPWTWQKQSASFLADEDTGRILNWPTKYTLYKTQMPFAEVQAGKDSNTPYNPDPEIIKKKPVDVQARTYIKESFRYIPLEVDPVFKVTGQGSGLKNSLAEVLIKGAAARKTAEGPQISSSLSETANIEMEKAAASGESDTPATKPVSLQGKRTLTQEASMSSQSTIGTDKISSTTKPTQKGKDTSTIASKGASQSTLGDKVLHSIIGSDVPDVDDSAEKAKQSRIFPRRQRDR